MKKLAVILLLVAHGILAVAQHETPSADTLQNGGRTSIGSAPLTFIKIMDDQLITETVNALSLGSSTSSDSQNNETAKRAFVARIELIKAEHEKPFGKLTTELKCIVKNFDLLTHNTYKVKKLPSAIEDIEIWYDAQSIANYEKWFKNNSGTLRHDPATGYLYVLQ